MTDGQFIVFFVLIPTLLIVTVWALVRDHRREKERLDDRPRSSGTIYTNGHWR